MRLWAGFLSALGVTAIVAAAAAQRGKIDNIGNAGGIVIGAERLAGGYVTKTKSEDSETVGSVTIKSEATVTTANFAIFGHEPASPTQVPRLALDYFPIDGLSFGGSLIYLRQSSELKSKSSVSQPGVPSQTVESEQQGPTQSVLVIHPRVGYAIAFNEVVGLWPRVGFSYARLVREQEDEPQPGITITQTVTTNLTNLTLEGLLFVSPFSNFALVGGPFVDIGLGGSSKVEIDGPPPSTPDQETDTSVTAYGFIIGLAAYFDTQ